MNIRSDIIGNKKRNKSKKKKFINLQLTCYNSLDNGIIVSEIKILFWILFQCFKANK